MTTSNNLPRWYWIISVTALVWNLLGVIQYFAQLNITDEMIEAMPAEQQPLYENLPGWFMTVFAIAVFSGLAGCIALLLRKQWAVVFFGISLAAVVVQNVYNLFLTDAIGVLGATAAVLPLLVVLASAALLWFSISAQKRGWIH
ncbi:hypothetical protein [Croceiramulus getboli]|nr:hypothetical protein P8624_11785 [Flavobacteriaceae bacterium YJPT1-3]